MSSDTFEKLKIEIRSVLLSSKHGIAEQDILNDYEQLLCQRLPFKELGFKDVKSLLQTMPDVAKEVRSPHGDVIYHAVSDESTAHIQKLVSSQMSKKKPKKFSGRRGGGHGKIHRGGFASVREGHGHNGKNVDRASPWPWEPRGPLLSKDGYLLKTQTNMLSRDPRQSHNDHSAKTSTSYSSRVSLTSRGGHPDRYRMNFASGDDGDSYRDLADVLNEDSWDVSDADESAETTKTLRAFCGAKHQVYAKPPFKNLKIELKRGKRIISEPATEPNDFQSDIADAVEESTLLICNLKIGTSQNGKRYISNVHNSAQKNFGSGNYTAHEDPRGSHSYFDLQDILNSRHHSDVIEDGENKPLNENRFRTKQLNSEARKTKRALKKNRISYQRNVPPRLQRMQNQDPVPNEIQDAQAQTRVEPHPQVSDQNTDQNNWIPAEDGDLFLEAHKNYFIQRGEAPPEIEIIPGELEKEKGYYGRLLHQDVHYYPLVIMKTEEHARQNVAKDFCPKNSIPIITKTFMEKDTKSRDL